VERKYYADLGAAGWDLRHPNLRNAVKQTKVMIERCTKEKSSEITINDLILITKRLKRAKQPHQHRGYWHVKHDLIEHALRLICMCTEFRAPGIQLTKA
jgi:hypothetical protein